MKKWLSLLLVCCVFLGIAAPALSEGIITPYYTRIAVMSTLLTKEGSSLRCYGSADSMYSSDQVSLHLALKQKDDNIWMPIKTFTGSGTGYASISKLHSVGSGTYKLTLTVTVRDSNGNVKEVASMDSKQVTK